MSDRLLTVLAGESSPTARSSNEASGSLSVGRVQAASTDNTNAANILNIFIFFFDFQFDLGY